MTNDLDRKARELWIAALAEAGQTTRAAALTAGWQLDVTDSIAISTITAALRLAVPDGFVVVPREPTQEMWDAATNRVKANTVVIDAGPAKGSTLMRDPIAHTWYAMIAAAPSAEGVE